MIKDLKNGTRGIERIVLYDCEEFDESTNEKFQVVRALGYHYVGILLKHAPRVMMSCVKGMVEEHHVGGSFEEPLECENNSKIGMNEYGSRKGLDHRDVTSIIMYVSTGLLVLMFVVGYVWNLMKTRNLPRQNEGKRKVWFKGFINFFQFRFKITIFLVSGSTVPVRRMVIIC